MTEFPPSAWRTSSYTGTGGQCVEVALTPQAVGVRDTKNRTGGHFTVSPQRWAEFVHHIKQHDLRP